MVRENRLNWEDFFGSLIKAVTFALPTKTGGGFRAGSSLKDWKAVILWTGCKPGKKVRNVDIIIYELSSQFYFIYNGEFDPGSG